VPAADPNGSSGGGAGVLAAEWFRAYTQYLKQSSDQSAGTVELYQRLSDQMARGEIAPNAAQDMLMGFMHVRGTAYNDELNSLLMRFFTALVTVATDYARELGDAVLPGIRVPAPPEPPRDASDPAAWFAELGDYAQRLSRSIASGYRALLERAAAGEVSPEGVERTVAGHLQSRLPEYLVKLSQLYFEILTGLGELRLRAEREFLSGVLERSDPQAVEPLFELRLEAPIGDEASASVSITNTRAGTAQIRCRLGEVRRADAVGPAFQPELRFSSDGLELPAGAETDLEVRLRLDPEHFEPGVVYVGSLEISGHGDELLEVPLRISATPSDGNDLA
jgi:hypothetical protein